MLIEEATALADAVCATATAAVADGVRECEVAGEAMRTLFRLGGEYAHVMTPFVASGEHMAPPHRICSDKLIRHGDIVFIDIGACWNGYFGDMARAVICGKPSDEQKKIYTAVYEGLQAGIAEMRPGRTNVDSAKALIRRPTNTAWAGASCRCSSATASASAPTSRLISARRCPARRPTSSSRAWCSRSSR